MELPKNKSKFRAVVLTADKFEDMEVFFPVFRLLDAGRSINPGRIPRWRSGYGSKDKEGPGNNEILLSEE